MRIFGRVAELAEFGRHGLNCAECAEPDRNRAERNFSDLPMYLAKATTREPSMARFEGYSSVFYVSQG